MERAQCGTRPPINFSTSTGLKYSISTEAVHETHSVGIIRKRTLKFRDDESSASIVDRLTTTTMDVKRKRLLLAIREHLLKDLARVGLLAETQGSNLKSCP